MPFFRFSVRHCFFLCLSACSLLVCGRAAFADTLPRDVREALQREAAGEVVNRRTAIKSDTPASRWHRGIVIHDGKPVEYESLKLSKSEQEYRARRSDQMGALQHLELAHWCKQEKYPERMRAHLQAVIKEQPNDRILRELIGHSFIDGRWYSPYDLAVAKRIANERARSLVKWMPRISRIARQCASRTTSVKRKAIRELAEIDAPESIHAIEATVYECSPVVGNLLLNKLADFYSVDCCMALARIAMDDAISPEIASHAEKYLVRYKPELYVPELLSLLEVHQQQTTVTTMPTGDLVLSALVVRELQDRKDVMQLRKYFVAGEAKDSVDDYYFGWRLFQARGNEYGAFRYGDPNLSRLKDGQQLWMVSKERYRWANTLFDRKQQLFQEDIRADEAALVQSFQAEHAILKSQLERNSRRTKSLNKRVMRLLRRTQEAHQSRYGTTMALPESDDVESWWSWWRKLNDLNDQHKDMSMHRAVSVEGDVGPTPVKRGPLGSSGGFCFAAGTPIQTSRGLVPIEDIAVGDLVMSQEIESGNLMLKPVFEILRRPETELLEVAVGAERFTSTSGHFWWVVGSGWVRTRELEAGMKVRTAKSVLEVLQVSNTPKPVNSYNLKIADFNSMFVGEQRILCSDNEFPRPSLRLVPGFGSVKR